MRYLIVILAVMFLGCEDEQTNLTWQEQDFADVVVDCIYSDATDYQISVIEDFIATGGQGCEYIIDQSVPFGIEKLKLTWHTPEGLALSRMFLTQCVIGSD